MEKRTQSLGNYETKLTRLGKYKILLGGGYRGRGERPEGEGRMFGL